LHVITFLLVVLCVLLLVWCLVLLSLVHLLLVLLGVFLVVVTCIVMVFLIFCIVVVGERRVLGNIHVAQFFREKVESLSSGVIAEGLLARSGLEEASCMRVQELDAELAVFKLSGGAGLEGQISAAPVFVEEIAAEDQPLPRWRVVRWAGPKLGHGLFSRSEFHCFCRGRHEPSGGCF
jgi:hypothetical protein